MDDPSPPSSLADNAGLTTDQLKQVLDISRFLAITADLETLLTKIAMGARDLVQCERASIWLHDEKTHELVTTVVLGERQLRVPVDSGIVGTAFRENRVITVNQAYEDPRFNPSSDLATGFKTRNLMATPMVDITGKPVGVIQAVNKKSGTFLPPDESLVQLLADQAGVAVQRHKLQVIARDAAEMHREMRLARSVQQALLPKILPQLASIDLFGWAKPASVTGGDCYDLWTLADGRMGIFLADASGHGLGPALVVSQARTLVRALCDGLPDACHPHDMLARVNRRMTADLDAERFVTAFLGFLDPVGTLHWQSAGHGPIFFKASPDSPLQTLQPPLPPINVMPAFPSDSPVPLQLKPGGLLAILSDGIFESFNPAGEQFGSARVAALLQETSQQSSIASAQALLTAVTAWQQHDQPRDDQTIVLIKRTAD